MNQQQLQTARTALWHQNAAPLETYDEAASWLEETGFCLFLPRHAQFPAPAPSLVEACFGAASATPAPDAIAKAMELTTRLVEAGQGIPLNLLGTFSEQPDFLITPEVLPWVAAVRGDRHWKTAPGGRTAPIVLRTWEAMEQRGGQTAAELRETLGREVTEAAVLRALIELWTTVRVIPVYAAGEATRWHLLKERYPVQLTAGANTAQATALSALISLYLRSAVAATAEEVEISLSPLTARSRIREVVHGMTAARQLGTMSVASHTLLFVEGSLPEVEPVAEPESERAAVAPERPERREQRAQQRPQRRPERQDRERREKRPPRFERENRGQKADRPPRREFRPAAPQKSNRPPGRPFEKGGEQRREGKPWQQRRGGGFQQREGRPPFRKPFREREERSEQGQGRPPFRKPFGRREERNEQGPERPSFRKPLREREDRPGEPQGRPPFRKPFGRREQRNEQGPERPPFRKPFREREERPGNREERRGFGKGPRPQFGKPFEGRPPRREQGGEERPQRPGKKFEGPPRFGRGDRPQRRDFRGERPDRRGTGGRGERPERGGKPAPDRRGAFRPGKKGRGKFNASSRPPAGQGKTRPCKNGKAKPPREEGSE